MALADLRREYNLAGLRRADLAPDPFTQFQRWFDQQTGARFSGRFRKFLIRIYKKVLLVTGAEPMDVNAMTLATTDKDGRPSARIVLLKGMDQRGFMFYTNYASRKGHELAENPNAALVFYWPDQERQINIAGRVEKLPKAESEKYFHSRPRGSRIGAWASDQSQPIKDRDALEAKWRAAEERFAATDVPMPDHWGGYILIPERVEFWQGRPNRLHDRFAYTRAAGSTWTISRLQP
jgi:pyridoxamine 5'-phosphate oxidase